MERSGRPNCAEVLEVKLNSECQFLQKYSLLGTFNFAPSNRKIAVSYDKKTPPQVLCPLLKKNVPSFEL